MLAIQQPTADTLQKQTLVLPDGTQIVIILCFKPLQYGWFLQELTYKSFKIYNLRIGTNPNILFQYRNLIPFGIACMTKDGFEPKLQQDFSSGYASLYVLTAAEVTELAGLYSG